jgi:hypothetical protein
VKNPVAIAFHAEKLHDDRTWRHVSQVARWMTDHDLKATFFVYPFRAQIAGKDITDRVAAIASLGHHIGQHTHFYAGTKIDKDKADDLSEDNVIYCLGRDFQTLQQMGFAPKAFTAGAWFVTPKVYDTLIGLGFSYDCSAQFPKPNRRFHSPYNSWLRSPRFYSNTQGRVLCLPTTCSLGEWFKWGRHITTDDKLAYQLIYLHDYDLVFFRNRLLLTSLLYLVRHKTIRPLSSIAQEFQKPQGDDFRSRHEI